MHKAPIQNRSRSIGSENSSMVIVHANSRHDPDEVSKKPIQDLIDKNIADYIIEFMAFHDSFVKHDGLIIDNNRNPGDYHLDDLFASDYILVGGGLGKCHYGAYASLVTARFGKNTTIHLPQDSIYRAYESYECGDSFLSSKISEQDMGGYARYKDLAKIVFDSYSIIEDGKMADCSERSSKVRHLNLMMWKFSDQMNDYLAEKMMKVD